MRQTEEGTRAKQEAAPKEEAAEHAEQEAAPEVGRDSQRCAESMLPTECGTWGRSKDSPRRLITQGEQGAAPKGAEKAPQDEATEEAPQKHTHAEQEAALKEKTAHDDTQTEEGTRAKHEAAPKEEAAQEDMQTEEAT